MHRIDEELMYLQWEGNRERGTSQDYEPMKIRQNKKKDDKKKAR